MMRRLVLLLAASTLGAVAAVWGAGSWTLKPPSRAWKEAAPPAGGSETSFTASDGIRLEGWWWPGARAKAVLLLHDAGGDRLEMMPRATWLHEEGYSVLLFDFRGCGRSKGQGSFGYGERLDVQAALGFLRQHYDEVVILGRGMGATAAVMAVDDWRGVSAAVLEQLTDRFESALRGRVRRQAGVLEPLLSPLLLMQVRPRLGFEPSELAPVDRLGRASCPVLLGFGALDKRLPAAGMSELFHAGPYPTTLWILQRAGEQDLYDFDPAAYRKKLREFLGPIEGNVPEGAP